MHRMVNVLSFAAVADDDHGVSLEWSDTDSVLVPVVVAVAVVEHHYNSIVVVAENYCCCCCCCHHRTL